METSELPESERNAVRAYLARAEVRQSTLHRIAVSFISGAGLLLLIPIFLRDVVESLLLIYLDLTAHLPFTNPYLNGVLFLTLCYPFVLSLAIPLYGVYLLVKDIVHFYFTIYTLGFPENLLNPTFSLQGLMLSPEDAPNVKKAAMGLQYQHPQTEFMMPFSEGRRELYFDQLIKDTDGEIIPSTREQEKLESVLPADSDWKDAQRINTAFGISRSLDRSLIEEVAITEMTITRNILYLRRLLLRYIKTFLMFLWTAVISFVALPFLEDGRFSNVWILALGYLIWSVLALRMIRWPIRWIYRHRYDSVPHHQIDAQLNLMERRITPLIWIAIVGVMLAIGLLGMARIGA